MGFFSWKTKDTGKVIYNAYSDFYFDGATKVHMVNPKTKEVFKEEKYEGYGSFGGKDFFILMAELNGLYHEEQDKMRSLAIALMYKKEDFWGNADFTNYDKEIIYPVLIENLENLEEMIKTNVEPECHAGQGFWK